MHCHEVGLEVNLKVKRTEVRTTVLKTGLSLIRPAHLPRQVTPTQAVSVACLAKLSMAS